MDSTSSNRGWSAPIRAGNPLKSAAVDRRVRSSWLCAIGVAAGFAAIVTSFVVGAPLAVWLAGVGISSVFVGITLALRRALEAFASRIDAVGGALQVAHAATLAREASLAGRDADTQARAEQATQRLERTAGSYAAEQARLHDVVSLSRDALRAMQEQLGRLAAIKPAQVEAVLVALRGQSRGLERLHGAMHASVAAHDAALDARAAGTERLADDVTERLRALVGDVDAALRDAAARMGDAAVRRVADELAPVGAAAADHADWLRASLARMRGETEALIGAQQAAAAVRSLSMPLPMPTPSNGPPPAVPRSTRLRTANARDLHAVLSTSGYVVDPD